MKRVLGVISERHDFSASDFVGGSKSLDFINTITGRNGRPRDWLPDYGSLVTWAVRREVIDQSEAQWLLSAGLTDEARDAALESAKQLRDCLHAVLTALLEGRDAESRDLDYVSETWRVAAAATNVKLDVMEGPVLSEPTDGLDTIRLRIAFDFVLRGSALRWSHFRVCEGHDCGWIFVDSSKSGRRKWCDMATCGNARKTKRFQAKKARSI